MQSIEINQKLSLSPELSDNAALRDLEKIQVTSEMELSLASQKLAEVRAKINKIEAEIKTVTAPIKNGIKKFEEMGKMVLSPLKIIDEVLKKRITDYMMKVQNEKDAAERKKREEEAAARKIIADDQAKLAMLTGSEEAAKIATRNLARVEKLETEPVAVSQTQKTASGTVAQQWYWDWSILDEKLVPREFLSVDEKKLNAAAKLLKEDSSITIPGVKFERKVRLAVIGAK